MNKLEYENYKSALEKYGYDWQYVSEINPFATDDDVSVFIKYNAYDLLIIFTNGEQYLVDMLRNKKRKLNIYRSPELTKEEWTYEFGLRLKDLLDRKYLRSRMVS